MSYNTGRREEDSTGKTCSIAFSQHLVIAAEEIEPHALEYRKSGWEEPPVRNQTRAISFFVDCQNVCWLELFRFRHRQPAPRVRYLIHSVHSIVPSDMKPVKWRKSSFKALWIPADSPDPEAGHCRFR
ncbi:hypothetical protein [Erythrobacter tepidarius]|uniref:hypothetical protein n=1 Tax=Erythrobacter tepidarius TaxID=60454 RepID=UPI00117E44B9|nr:hypothetical protein [Erythrobacter tepidarius]